MFFWLCRSWPNSGKIISLRFLYILRLYLRPASAGPAISACHGKIPATTPNTCQTQSAKSPTTNTKTLPKTIKEISNQMCLFCPRFFYFQTSKTNPERMSNVKVFWCSVVGRRYSVAVFFCCLITLGQGQYSEKNSYGYTSCVIFYYYLIVLLLLSLRPWTM